MYGTFVLLRVFVDIVGKYREPSRLPIPTYVDTAWYATFSMSHNFS